MQEILKLPRWCSFFYLAIFVGLILLAPKPALAGNLQLSGTVADSSSIAIADATVDVIDSSTHTITVSTTTDSSGNYSVSIADGTYDIQVTPSVSSPFGPAIAPSRTISASTIVNFTLISSGSVTLSGHIFDPNNNPLVNQHFYLIGSNGSGPVTETFSDSTGSFSLRVSPASNYRFILDGHVLGTTYELATNNFVLTQSVDLNIVLPVNQVTIHVQDPASNPLSWVDVSISSPINVINRDVSLGGYASVIAAGISADIATDASGDSVFWLFATDANNSSYRYGISAVPPSGSPYSPANVSGFAVTGTTSLAITLQEPVTFSGHIYDPNGSPLSGQHIYLIGNNGSGSISQMVTGSTGAFSLDVAPASNYRFILDGTVRGTSFEFSTNDFSMTQDLSLELTLPAYDIPIHVQNGSSIPLSDVTVSARSPISVINRTLSLAPGISVIVSLVNADITTDSNGLGNLWLFATDSNSTSFTYTLSATPPSGSGYPSSSISNVFITGNESFTFTLAQPVTLSGRIYDPNGNPLSGQHVLLIGSNGSGALTSTTTDSNGSYLLLVSASPNYRFNIFGTVLGSAYDLTRNNYSLTQDTSLDITLPVHAVTVHVQGASNNGLGNMSVSVRSPANVINTNTIIGGSVSMIASGVSADTTTNSSGDALVWLYSTDANNTSFRYTIGVVPPNGSIYAPASLANVAVTGDQSEIISLQFIHARPVTTATLTPAPNERGFYSDPTTVTLSASAASGYTVANTYFTVDGGAQQTYTAPFAVSGGGSHNITYWSVDNVGVPEAPNSQTFSIVSLVITTTSLPAATVTGAYSQTIQSSGGTTPFSWSVISGTLPTGLSLNSPSGQISGTPTVAGTYNFTVQVSDANSQTATSLLTIVVNVAPSITRNNTPDVHIGHSYNQTITGAGGTPSLSWSISAGSLPPGLSLNSSTGAIFGTPTTLGTYNFTIRVTDSNNVSVRKAFSIQVKP